MQADVEKITAEMRARIEAYPASYSSEARKLDRALLDELSRLREAERRAIEALTRLGSPEAFCTPRMSNAEERARMFYADEALSSIRALSTQVEERE